VVALLESICESFPVKVVPAAGDCQVWSYVQELAGGKRAYSFPIAAPVCEVRAGSKSSPNWVANGMEGAGDTSK
jgi:hypothetical protein